MKDRRLLLVGRADPTGEGAYNDELGLVRAKAIREILIGAGVDAARIDIASLGERGARGDTEDQASGYDRRVDVIVLDGPHVPRR